MYEITQKDLKDITTKTLKTLENSMLNKISEIQIKLTILEVVKRKSL